jgi:hypothetical protein
MNSPSKIITPGSLSRRTFLRSAGAVAAASALPIERFAFGASNNDTLKLALVGAGGRGSGACNQALNTTNLGPVKLVAMAEVHEDRLTGALKNFQKAHPRRRSTYPRNASTSASTPIKRRSLMLTS